MSDTLDQSEIDALLNSASIVDDDPVDMDDTQGQDFEQPQSGKSKHIAILKSGPYRFNYEYHSPVIKSKKVIVDPDNEHEAGSGIVVQSLNSYIQHKNRKE